MTQVHARSPEQVGTIVGAAYGLVALASSATAVVVPTIRDDFELSLTRGSWVITAFVIALAATAPIYGRLADNSGARGPITAGLILLVVGSALSAVAPSVAVLVAARAIQGAGAGAIPVLAPAIIAAQTVELDRPRALTRMSAIAAASATGLLLGAVLAEIAGWRPVVTIPLVAVALIGPLRRISDEKPGESGPVDYVGAIGVAAVAVGLTLTTQIRTNATSGGVGLGLLAGGGALIGGSLQRAQNPFLPSSILKRPITWQAGLAGASIPAAYFALLIAIPAILTDRHGTGRIAIGALLFPAVLAGIVVGPAARVLRPRMSGPRLCAVGLLLAAVALVLAAALAAQPVGLTVAFALVVVSFGLGQAALLNELTGATPPHERGLALAVFMVMYFTGGGVGSALLAAIAEIWSLTTALAILAVLPVGGALLAMTINTPLTDE